MKSFGVIKKSINPVSAPNIYLLSIYLIFSGLGLRFSASVNLADIFVPFMAIQVVVMATRKGLGIYAFSGLMLLLYTFASIFFMDLPSFYSLIYPVALLYRTALLVLAGIYVIFAAKISSSFSVIRAVAFASKVTIFSSLIATVVNILSSQKAYYGFSQIAFNSSPAISGFVIGTSSLYLAYCYFLGPKKACRKSDLITSFIGIILALGTLSLANFSSLAIGFIPLLIAFIRRIGIQTLSHTSHFKFPKFFLAFLLLSVWPLYHVLASGFIDILYRLGRIFDKLDGRFDKVDDYLSLCKSFECLLFGAGPGYHTVLQGNIPGERSMLVFDQLYGRLLYEWGLIGCLFFIMLFITLICRNNNNLIMLTPGLASFGLLFYGLGFGFGSEFLFVSPSGVIFSALLAATTYLLPSTPSNSSTKQHSFPSI